MRNANEKLASGMLEVGARTLVGVMALGLAGVLSGCANSLTSNIAASPVVTGAAMQGRVIGGQQPVSGAALQLYAVGTAGYGSAATPLLTPGAVTSSSTGSFSITGDYTCPSSAAQVYITATGGNSGSGTNANLALMAALGSCGNLSSATFIQMNELTTVGSVYALAPFMTGPANIGTTPTNTSGLVNAFADVNTLTNITNGTVPGPGLPSSATAPTSEINTLADIVAACVNTNGGTAGTTVCGKLFAAATPAGGTAPTDTITALLDIAQHPGNNVSTLFALSSASSPFQPTLSTPPNDFSIGVNFTGGGINTPSALASDAFGNIWIANQSGNTVTELSNAGAVLSGTGYTASLNSPSSIALDSDGTVWITNQGNNTVSRLTSSGGSYAGSPYSGGGLNLPYSIAFDSLGSAWIANHGSSSITTISTGGTLTSYTPAAVATPISIAVNPH